MSLVIGIDGLGYGEQGFDATSTPEMDSLMDGSWADDYFGFYSDQAFAGGVRGASTQQPTVSGPGWSTILTGVWVNRHGVRDNSFAGKNYAENPTYLETLEESISDLYSATFVNWSPIDREILSSINDDNFRLDVRSDLANDIGVAHTAAAFLRDAPSDRPTAVFVALDDVDLAGHSCGSSNSCYQNSIRIADILVGRMLKSIRERATIGEEQWQVVVTSDHGHRASGGHGGQSRLERRIPLIVSSRNVHQNQLPTVTPFSHADVAPTVLDHFGVGIPDRYEGHSRAGLGTTAPGLTPTLLFSEDFENVPLGQNVDEDIPNIVDHVWSKNGPPNWTVVDRVPGQNEPKSNNGVTEWIGWSFTNKDWWIGVAQDQQRSEFTNGQGTIAVADPDEWDDQPHPDSANSGWYNTFLSTPEITLDGILANSVELEFASSWRDEFDGNFHQTANIAVSYDDADPVEVLRWESNPNDLNFKNDATNETIRIKLNNPPTAKTMVVTFGLFDAGNDWWWAIDNIDILAIVQGDLNSDGFVNVDDIDLLSNATDRPEFDFNQDEVVDFGDRRVLIEEILNTWFGDANLDGEFNSQDLVRVFQIGEYETKNKASWKEGDWDGDTFFTTSDFVVAFQGGGFEQGPRNALLAVPETENACGILICSIALFGSRCRKNLASRLT